MLVSGGHKPVAAGDFNPGAVIWEENPIVSFPNIDFELPCSRSTFNRISETNNFIAPEGDDNYFYSELLETVESVYPLPVVAQVCFGCYEVRKDGLSWECSMCGIPLCSSKCEESFNHKNQECQALQQLNLKVGGLHRNVKALYMDVATLRALILRDSERQDEFCRIMDLTHHARVANFRTGNLFHIFLASDHLPLELVLPVSIRLAQNAKLVVDVCSILEGMSGVSPSCFTKKSLYGFCASLEHNCMSNCMIIPHMETSSDRVTLVSAAALEAGELLTVDVLQKPLCISRSNRRTLLQQKYVFDCGCTLCCDATDLNFYHNALRCSSCKVRGYVVPSEPRHYDRHSWKCDGCDVEISWKEVKQLLEKSINLVKSFPLEYKYKRKFVCLKAKFLRRFHPNHYIILGIEGVLAKLALRRGTGGITAVLALGNYLDVPLLEDYKNIRNYLVQFLRFMRNSYSIERGLALYQLFHVELVLAMPKLNEHYVNIYQEVVNLRLQVEKLRESALLMKKLQCTTSDVVDVSDKILKTFDEFRLMCRLIAGAGIRRNNEGMAKLRSCTLPRPKIPWEWLVANLSGIIVNGGSATNFNLLP